MLAQRAPEAYITGVDIDDVSQARENADASPWGGRVAFERCPVQEFAAPETFDLIVSNPPFFVDSLTCPDEGRTAVRHAVHLPFDDLRDAVLRLLAPAGRFAVILPTPEAARFLAVCAGRLALTRRTDVRTTPRRPAKRALMEFARADGGTEEPETSELVVGTGEPRVLYPRIPRPDPRFLPEILTAHEKKLHLSYCNKRPGP